MINRTQDKITQISEFSCQNMSLQVGKIFQKADERVCLFYTDAQQQYYLLPRIEFGSLCIRQVRGQGFGVEFVVLTLRVDSKKSTSLLLEKKDERAGRKGKPAQKLKGSVSN